MSSSDDESPLPLPAFVTRVRNPEDRPFEERHPSPALLALLPWLALLLLVILLWLLLFSLIRPLEWLYACARRRPCSTAPLTGALRARLGNWLF